MFDRLINLPFKVLGRAARVVVDRHDAATAQSHDASPDQETVPSNIPRTEVPDDFEIGDLSIDAESLQGIPTGDGTTLFVDVRPLEAYKAGHIDGAVHIPLNLLGLELAELPALTRFITVCSDGDDSQLAARFLRYRGLEDSWNLAGGLDAWRKANGPLETS